MADIKDYESWKCGDLLLDMESGEFVDVLAGVEIRKKLVKKIQKDDGLFCPESFEDLTISEQLLGALTYEEFKYIIKNFS